MLNGNNLFAVINALGISHANLDSKRDPTSSDCCPTKWDDNVTYVVSTDAGLVPQCPTSIMKNCMHKNLML